jgi:hypothetical protein
VVKCGGSRGSRVKGRGGEEGKVEKGRENGRKGRKNSWRRESNRGLSRMIFGQNGIGR